MATFIISDKDMTGKRLGTIEASTIGEAASTAARKLLGHDVPTTRAARVTGDAGKSGCFRVSTPGPNRNGGERALGRQFHVREA